MQRQGNKGAGELLGEEHVEAAVCLCACCSSVMLPHNCQMLLLLLPASVAKFIPPPVCSQTGRKEGEGEKGVGRGSKHYIPIHADTVDNVRAAEKESKALLLEPLTKEHKERRIGKS